MDNNRRNELKRAYKETVPRKGVFKIHATTTGQTWVGTATNVDSVENRVWFTLRMGNHPTRKLQQAWTESGPDAMQFAVVEVFPEEVTGYELERLMKERKQHWLAELGAEPYQ